MFGGCGGGRGSSKCTVLEVSEYSGSDELMTVFFIVRYPQQTCYIALHSLAVGVFFHFFFGKVGGGPRRTFDWVPLQFMMILLPVVILVLKARRLSFLTSHIHLRFTAGKPFPFKAHFLSMGKAMFFSSTDFRFLFKSI